MTINISYDATNYLICGYLKDDLEIPLIGTLVTLNSITNTNLVFSKITDLNGYFEFYYPRTVLIPGVYEVKAYGNGIVQKFYPDGDWKTIELIDPTKSISAIINTNTIVVKKENSLYFPSTIIATAEVIGLDSITYVWKIDEIINAENSSILTLESSNIFSNKTSINISCDITGIDALNTTITITRTVTIVQLMDGVANEVVGPGIVYRGHYDTTKQYIRTTLRRDVVSILSNNKYIYKICKLTTTDPAGIYDENTYWEDFGETFSSVATSILLAEDATITRILTIGTEGSNIGIIRSANADNALLGDGFYLSVENNSGIFRIGAVTNSNLVKGVYWDGLDLQIKSTNYELTSSGNLWAQAGGFGGTAASPSINITSIGLQAGQTYLNGNTSWKEPTFTTIPLTNDGSQWSLVGQGNTTTNEIQLLDAGSYVLQSIVVDAENVGKIYSFKSNYQGTDGSLTAKHKIQIDVIFEGSVVLTKTFLRANNKPAGSYSISYSPTTTGTLQFKVTYLGEILGVEELPMEN